MRWPVAGPASDLRACILAMVILTATSSAVGQQDSDPIHGGVNANELVSDETSDSARTAEGVIKKLPKTISFNAHIRPIMSETCFTCHGPDDEANPSGLRLDSFAAAVDEGGAIEPGDVQSSLVYQRLTDQDDPMPPADFRHQLSPYEIALFRRWIKQGAEYEPHWSYAPLRRPEVPTVARPEKVANEIDAFVLSRLEFEGLASAPRADKSTLLRRLSLDLIGMPPTPAELAAFLEDESADAYSKQVERLLDSPHYGERMASQWLDAVHFTDTVGFHGDQNQRVFAYRDYVIDSINQNKPFDQFTREQLAGDLLPNPTDQQRIATALIRLNMMTREGGAQPEEYLAKYTADRVRMLGTAWLGVTTGCCECHNHKYDPLTAKDFYSLGAFFDDLRQWGVYTTYQYTPNPELADFTNDSPFPPELRSRSASLLRQIESLEDGLAKSIAEELLNDDNDQSILALGTDKRSEQAIQWVESLAKVLKEHDDGWVPVEIEACETHSEESSAAVLADNSVLISGVPQPEDRVIAIGKLHQPLLIKAIRLEVLPDAAHDGYVGRGKEGRFSLEFSVSIVRDDAVDADPSANSEPKSEADSNGLSIAFTQVDRLNPNAYHGGFESRFLQGPWRAGPAAWQLPVDETSLPHTAVYHLETSQSVSLNDRLQFDIKSNDVGRVRVSVSPLTRYVAGMPAADETLRDAVAQVQSGGTLSQQQNAKLVAAYFLATTPAKSLSAKIKKYRDLIAECRSGYAMTMVAVQTDPDKWRHSRVLPRGDWQDESGPAVVPATPDFLPQLPAANQRRLTRHDLANWLTSSENPLTARHYVNRTWKHFFGAGLSNKLDDLGNQGEWPSHPLLLDWLAATFRDSWDMKQITRLIVNSNTYQQAVTAHSPATEVDPYNRLLAQQSPRRLEAEMVRDNALAISGLLFDDYIGGPSVFPYQPADYYSNLQFPDRRYDASPFVLQYRRGVYMHWQRTFLHPMLVNFDAPLRDECTADRNGSNSPQQALTLLNDAQFVEASIAFANRLLVDHPQASFEQRLEAAFLRAVSRPPAENEQTGLLEFFQRQKKYYAKHEKDVEALLFHNGNFRPTTELDPVELAAWSQVCRVILNLHETITRY